MSKPKVLFVLTSHNKLGNLDKPTGWYLPEMAHPYHVLAPHAQITVASPSGGEAPLDPSSIEAFKEEKQSTDFLNTKQELWKTTEKLSDVKASDYDAIFYVGGHGPMFDLSGDKLSQKLIADAYESGKIVAAVCHGPAAFVNVTLSSGKHLLEGVPVTGFSNEEEEQAGLTDAMPFLLETELDKASGGKYEKAGDAWGPKVVSGGEGGRVITGQNPASATGIGEAILAALRK
ncbi:MAG: hypothetical protein MMC33_008477 [Icmadophila ericetorum]|nr:hypothetical protein [Icmadophila ericetorum]